MSAGRILYIQYAPSGGYPPLVHSSRMLAERGWEVQFVCAGSYGTQGLDIEPAAGISVNQLLAAGTGWHQRLAYLRFCREVLGTAARWRPDWVYASDTLAALPALLVTRLRRLPVVYHEHDAPSGAAGGPLTRLCVRLRRRLARQARLCVLPNAERAALFATETGGARTVVVWNCPRRAEVSAARRPNAGAPLLTYYHGSINRLLVPESLLMAVGGLGDRVRLRVVGYETIGARGYLDNLRQIVRKAGLADRVELRPATTRAGLWSESRGGDVGFGCMPMETADVNHRHMVGASNKIFDYLAQGMALLVSDLPEWRAAFVDAGLARPCDPSDARSIAAALRWCVDNRDEVCAMGERGRQRVLDEWNYDRQFTPVLEALVGSA